MSSSSWSTSHHPDDGDIFGPMCEIFPSEPSQYHQRYIHEAVCPFRPSTPFCPSESPKALPRNISIAFSGSRWNSGSPADSPPTIPKRQINRWSSPDSNDSAAKSPTAPVRHYVNQRPCHQIDTRTDTMKGDAAVCTALYISHKNVNSRE